MADKITEGFLAKWSRRLRNGFLFLGVVFLLRGGLVLLGVGQAHPLPPCDELPETGSVGEVSVFFGQDASSHERICLRILNLSDASLHYGLDSYRIQSRWFSLFWGGTLQVVSVVAVGFILPPGNHRDRTITLDPFPYSLFPQQYRACFRFDFSGQTTEKQEVCSAPFSHEGSG